MQPIASTDSLGSRFIYPESDEHEILDLRSAYGIDTSTGAQGVAPQSVWGTERANREADVLSIGQFGDFTMASRVEISEDSISYLLLPELLMKGALLYGVDEAEKADERNKAAGSKAVGKKTSKGERLKVADPW